MELLHTGNKSAFLGQKVKQAWHNTGFAGFAAEEDVGCQGACSLVRFAQVVTSITFPSF